MHVRFFRWPTKQRKRKEKEKHPWYYLVAMSFLWNSVRDLYKVLFCICIALICSKVKAMMPEITSFALPPIAPEIAYSHNFFFKQDNYISTDFFVDYLFIVR